MVLFEPEKNQVWDFVVMRKGLEELGKHAIMGTIPRLTWNRNGSSVLLNGNQPLVLRRCLQAINCHVMDITEVAL